jgi:hypothetical protein
LAGGFLAGFLLADDVEGAGRLFFATVLL